LLSKQSHPWTVSLVEADPKLFAQLVDAIEKDPNKNGMFENSLVKQGEFAQFVPDILTRQIYSRFGAVATFAFIDPCGARGVRMADIARIMSKAYGECLLFWNYDGISRWLGAVAAATHPIDGLVELFGDEKIVQNALRICAGILREKERMLRDLFLNSIKRYSAARFLLPFRFEARDSSRTSHYLVHCCNDGLAFKIMKHVMDRAASNDEGTFQLLNDTDTRVQMGMFRPHFDQARTEILRTLDRGTTPVHVFTEDWVRRPTDLMTSKGYRRLLLELEKSGDIQVLDKTGTIPVPSDTRRKIRGKTTLGDNYILRRSK
jgi:three-Cys-motif partner protein